MPRPNYKLRKDRTQYAPRGQTEPYKLRLTFAAAEAMEKIRAKLTVTNIRPPSSSVIMSLVLEGKIDLNGNPR